MSTDAGERAFRDANPLGQKYAGDGGSDSGGSKDVSVGMTDGDPKGDAGGK